MELLEHCRNVVALVFIIVASMSDVQMKLVELCHHLSSNLAQVVKASLKNQVIWE